MFRMLYLLLIVTEASLADEICPPMCFCSKDLTSVNCDGKHLTAVPENLPSNVVKLYLSFNLIPHVNTSAFGNLPNLEKLYLLNNKISAIESFAFGNLSSLDYLDLRGNKLTEIRKHTFSDMKSLETLRLETNKIMRVYEEAFVGSLMLTVINFQSNKLTSVPPLGVMPNLQQLVLEGNQITDATFPSTFETSKKLSSVILSNNLIMSLGNTTFEFLRNNSVSSLYLSRNKISQVESGTFTPLASITSLKLGINPIDANTLRSAIVSLKGKKLASLDISQIQLNGVIHNDTFALLKNMSITTLNMRFNRLPFLPDGAFSGLNKLLHLDLSNCDMQETSQAAFDGLDKLTILILNKNKLVAVPKNLPSSLTNLYMDQNDITTIADKSFFNLAYLQELRLRFNKIQTLEQGSFLGLMQLNKLSLYSNNIATLPGEVFEPLVRLTSLDLANNNLVSIQYAKGRFSALGSLQYINLADNNMVYFQPDLFQDTVSLKYLHLERNDLGIMISRDYGGQWLRGLANLNSLYLMNNNIKDIPDPAFQDLSSLELLNLTNNKLTGWGANLFKSAQNLQFLDLSFNLIATVTQQNVDDFRAMKTLNLTGNPFACNCDLRWFRDWMNKTKIELTNNASYRCAGPNGWAGQPVLAFDKSKINCFFLKWWYILISCCGVAFLIIIIATFMYRRRWWIKLSLYKLTRRNRRRKLAPDGRGNYGAIDDLEGGKIFDAYISCAEEDKTWVLEHLLPDVDNGQLDDDQKFNGHYRLFFEDRDADAGQWKTGIVYENMTCSRKVILVLSRHYLNSPLHMWEFDLATRMMYDKELEDIVVVDIAEGLPERMIPKQLAHTMKRNKVVEWRDTPEARQHFKLTINEMLRSRAAAADMDAE